MKSHFQEVISRHLKVAIMANSIEKKYLFSVSEILVLLAIEGCERIVGLFDVKSNSIGTDEITKILFRLHQKRIVEQYDNKMRIRDEYKKIVDGLIQAETLLVFSAVDENYPEYSLYMGKECIEAYCRDDGKMMVFSSVDPIQVIHTISEKGFRINTHISREVDKTVLDSSIVDAWGLNYRASKEEILELPGVAGVCILGNAKELNERVKVILISRELNDYVVLLTKREQKLFRYSPKILSEILSELVEEKI